MSSHNSSSSNNVVGAHYRVGKKIGEGSFGVIFEGVYAHEPSPCAPAAPCPSMRRGPRRRRGNMLIVFVAGVCRHKSVELADRSHQIRMCPLISRCALLGHGVSICGANGCIFISNAPLRVHFRRYRRPSNHPTSSSALAGAEESRGTSVA